MLTCSCCLTSHQNSILQYNRLPFGVSSAPAKFQRAMETLLQGFTHTCVYIDDIVVTGRTTEEHLNNLGAVLEKLEAAGLKLNRNKCVFMAPSVEYLGHRIDKDGLHPTEDKVKCIKEAATPQNVTELKAFFGTYELLCEVSSTPCN